MAAIDTAKSLNPQIEAGNIPELAQRLARFKQASTQTLPEDYEAFLRADGHEMFFPDNRVAGHADVRLNSFYGLDDRRTTLFTALAMYEGRLPPGIIAIGDSGGGGDLICLDAAGLSPGAVYHWDHEREVDAQGQRQPDFSNMTKLADSFSAFLESVTARDESQTPPPKVKKVSLRF
jgi:hypothetical protein